MLKLLFIFIYTPLTICLIIPCIPPILSNIIYIIKLSIWNKPKTYYPVMNLWSWNFEYSWNFQTYVKYPQWSEYVVDLQNFFFSKMFVRVSIRARRTLLDQPIPLSFLFAKNSFSIQFGYKKNYNNSKSCIGFINPNYHFLVSVGHK